jgi:hypothetical protein
MPRPRKHQLNVPQTKYTKYVYADHGPSPQLGQSTWTLTGADYTNFISTMVTPGPGGVEADTPATIVSSLDPLPPEPIAGLNVGKRFSVKLPGVNGGSAVTITLTPGDFTTLNGNPLSLTAASVINRINSDLAAFAVPPPASNVASRDDGGRIVLTSVDAVGVTYGDSAQITIADVDPGTCALLGFAVSGVPVYGVTAPERGIVTASADRRGGVVPTRFGNGAAAVTRTNSVKYAGLDLVSGLPVYVPDIVGGKKITVRLTHDDSVPPAWVFSCTAPGTNKEIRSYGARIFDLLVTDALTFTYAQYGILNVMLTGPGSIPTVPNMAAVAGFFNTRWHAATGTGYAVCHGEKVEPFVFSGGETLIIELNGVSHTVTVPGAGVATAASVIIAIGSAVPPLPAGTAVLWAAPDGNRIKLVDPSGGSMGSGSVIRVLPGLAAEILGLPARKHTGVEIAFVDGEELVLKCPGPGDDAVWTVADAAGTTPMATLGLPASPASGTIPRDASAPLFNAYDATEGSFVSLQWLIPESMECGDIPSMEDTEVVRELTEQANIHIDPNNAADQGGQPLFSQWDGLLPILGTGSDLVGYTNSLTPFNTALGRGAGGAGGGGAVPASGLNNVFSGYHAGLITTGSDNVIIGSEAAPVATTIASNVVIGRSAGAGLTTASHDSVVIGKEAGYNYTTGCVNSVMIGSQAGYGMMASNIAIGYKAMYGTGAGTGYANIAIGEQSLLSVSTGFENVAIGRYVLNAVTTGSRNVAIGEGAFLDGTGSNNVGVGAGVGDNITGSNNVFIGHNAVGEGTGGIAAYNVVVGSGAGYKLYGGARNVAVGLNSGYFLGSIGKMIAIGSDALFTLAAADPTYSHVAIGDSALLSYNVGTASGCVAVGFEAAKNVALGTFHTVVGCQAALSNSGDCCTAIGYWAARNNTADNTIAIGKNAARGNTGNDSIAVGASTAYNNAGGGCIAIGNSAARDNGVGSTGANVIAIGSNAASNNTGAYLVSIGEMAGRSNDGDECVAIGYWPAYDNQGDGCIAIGTHTAANNTGMNCMAVGSSAAYLNSGTNFVAIGYQAGANAAVTLSNTGDDCIAIGTNACGNNSGDKSIGIGSNAAGNNTGNNCVAIGESSAAFNAGDNCVLIGTNAGSLSLAVGAVDCVLIGSNAGQINKAAACVAIGLNAAYGNDGANCIAIGELSARDNHGIECIAIGNEAAKNNIGDNNIAIGCGAARLRTATGDRRIAIGYFVDDDAGYSGDGTIAVGNGAFCSANYAVSIGNNARTSAVDGIAIGDLAEVTAIDGIAIGSDAYAYAANAIAIGDGTNNLGGGGGIESIAIGKDAHCSSTDYASVAIGSGAWCSTGVSGGGFVAIGQAAGGIGHVGVAVGAHANADGHSAVAVGTYAVASVSDAIAIGDGTEANSIGAIAIGGAPGALFTYAVGDGAIAIGGSHGINFGAHADADDAIAIGVNSQATIAAAIAIGLDSQSIIADAIAIGNGAVAGTTAGNIQLGAGTNSGVTRNLQIGMTGAGTTYNAHCASWAAYSDERIKTNIAPLSDHEGLRFIERLCPVKFNFKEWDQEFFGRPRFGLIAQWVKNVMVEDGMAPHALYCEASDENPASTWSLDYNQLVAPLIKAVQELSGMVKSQQAEIEDLKKKVG